MYIVDILMIIDAKLTLLAQNTHFSFTLDDHCHLCHHFLDLAHIITHSISGDFQLKSKYTHWLLQHMAGNHRLVAKVAEVLVAAAVEERWIARRKGRGGSERKRACEELHRYICYDERRCIGQTTEGIEVARNQSLMGDLICTYVLSLLIIWALYHCIVTSLVCYTETQYDCKFLDQVFYHTGRWRSVSYFIFCMENGNTYSKYTKQLL